jgi:hypothetical protein
LILQFLAAVLAAVQTLVAVVARVASSMFLECQLQQVVMELPLAGAAVVVAIPPQKEVQAVVLLRLGIHLLAEGAVVLALLVITPVSLALLAAVRVPITNLELLPVVLGQQVIMVVTESPLTMVAKHFNMAVVAVVVRAQPVLVVLVALVLVVLVAQEHLTLLLELPVLVVAVRRAELVMGLAGRAGAAVPLVLALKIMALVVVALASQAVLALS